MLTGILIVAVVGLLAVLSYRVNRLEEKVLKNVPMVDWLQLLIFPVLFYIGWVWIVKNILAQPATFLFPLDDLDILAITIIFMVYSFVGNAMHFNAKILSRYLKGHEHTMVYRVNEMFHDKLSHYIVFMSSLFIIFLLFVLEINHPAAAPLAASYLRIVTLAGIVFGASAFRGILYYGGEYFGNRIKPLSLVALLLFAALLLFIHIFRIKFSFYPVTLFVACVFVSVILALILRHILVLLRLDEKRRLKLLLRFLGI